ncbi:hypothetical protein BDQ94DRAFT_152377 [Aspergillus welwitschiae]|uniref:Uncharacterized protein n=1 Tax=Aspergillus welwitschiae TaxID=1341132 RepID=A0A3F3PMV3_9EURO|nr:hypothetical protein BDQ94DRAFT_152377 [Aspergillus welwitschiae]RDH28244.1 hypothetical protein BDQ94DRAFT_152377 [Aspergillus welwitschiae]
MSARRKVSMARERKFVDGGGDHRLRVCSGYTETPLDLRNRETQTRPSKQQEKRSAR